MFFSLGAILIQEMVQVQGFVKVELSIILIEPICAEIPLDTLQIENKSFRTSLVATVGIVEYAAQLCTRCGLGCEK